MIMLTDMHRMYLDQFFYSIVMPLSSLVGIDCSKYIHDNNPDFIGDEYYIIELSKLADDVFKRIIKNNDDIVITDDTKVNISTYSFSLLDVHNKPKRNTSITTVKNIAELYDYHEIKLQQSPYVSSVLDDVHNLTDTLKSFPFPGSRSYVDTLKRNGYYNDLLLFLDIYQWDRTYTVPINGQDAISIDDEHEILKTDYKTYKEIINGKYFDYSLHAYCFTVLHEQEQAILKEYTKNWDKLINTNIDGNHTTHLDEHIKVFNVHYNLRKFTSSIRSKSSTLQDITTGYKLPRNVILYRGVHTKQEAFGDVGDFILERYTNMFQSTSMNERVARGFVEPDMFKIRQGPDAYCCILRIHAKKGQLGLPIPKDFTYFKHEQEVLLPMQTRLRIIGRDGIYIDCEIYEQTESEEGKSKQKQLSVLLSGSGSFYQSFRNPQHWYKNDSKWLQMKTFYEMTDYLDWMESKKLRKKLPNLRNYEKTKIERIQKLVSGYTVHNTQNVYLYCFRTLIDKEIQIGNVLSYNSKFILTTLDKNIAIKCCGFGQSLLRIHVKNGQSLLPLYHYQQYPRRPDHLTVLLPPGTCFRILSLDHFNTMHFIDVEMVQDDTQNRSLYKNHNTSTMTVNEMYRTYLTEIFLNTLWTYKIRNYIRDHYKHTNTIINNIQIPTLKDIKLFESQCVRCEKLLPVDDYDRTILFLTEEEMFIIIYLDIFRYYIDGDHNIIPSFFIIKDNDTYVEQRKRIYNYEESKYRLYPFYHNVTRY
jgi:hypothetical protein